MTPSQQLRCPAGHPSESDDYCDVCGSPMTAAGSGTPQPAEPAEAAEPAGPEGIECPNCQVLNAPGALFCEACGYDYTTGTMPRPRPNPLDLDSPAPPPGAPTQPPSAPDAPAAPPLESAQPPEPEAEPVSAGPVAATPAEVPAEQNLAEAVLVEPKSAPAAAAVAPPQDERPAEQPVDAASQATPPRAPRTDASAAAPAAPPDAEAEWVLEVWIDPEWYALQQSPDPMPSPGLPHVQPVRRRTMLIGRPSRSRGITPDIDCEPDSGISRRHAQLSTDGRRWFLEDLDSANGTYVAPAAAALPTTPIASGRRTELDPDDRIYLGAWTRLVLRPATPEEQELYAEG